VRVGTRSVLFGAHCWAIHPLFVAAAWTQLYGFPTDPRLWLAFAVHDLGYWGKPDMDGPAGETHPELGARIMRFFCDRISDVSFATEGTPVPRGWVATGDVVIGPSGGRLAEYEVMETEWHDLALYHSRYYAKRDGARPSRLCVADKLAFCLEPWWLYLPRVILSGEIHEYVRESMARGDARGGRYESMALRTREGYRAWHADVRAYLLRWVEEHRDGRPDTWTPAPARDATGAPYDPLETP